MKDDQKNKGARGWRLAKALFGNAKSVSQSKESKEGGDLRGDREDFKKRERRVRKEKDWDQKVMIKTTLGGHSFTGRLYWKPQDREIKNATTKGEGPPCPITRTGRDCNPGGMSHTLIRKETRGKKVSQRPSSPKPQHGETALRKKTIHDPSLGRGNLSVKRTTCPLPMRKAIWENWCFLEYRGLCQNI